MTDVLNGQLYLGGSMDVNDEFLIFHKIRTIINVAHECDDTLSVYCQTVKVYKFYITDTLDSIYKYFSMITSLIKRRLIKGHVLIHCMMGVSRSASMTLAYLMIYYHMNLLHAYNYIYEKRQILPNPQFMVDLMKLETELFDTHSFEKYIDHYNITYIIYRTDLQDVMFNVVKEIYYQSNKDYREIIEAIDNQEFDLIDQPCTQK